jgi:hypothetical protein
LGYSISIHDITHTLGARNIKKACFVAVLLRILSKIKKGEKERLRKRIQELEEELQTLKGKMK